MTGTPTVNATVTAMRTLRLRSSRTLAPMSAQGRQPRGAPDCEEAALGHCSSLKTARHGEEPVLQAGMDQPDTVDGDPGLDEAAGDLVCLLLGLPGGERDGQPVLGEGDAGCDRELAEGSCRCGRIRALHLDGNAGLVR